MSKFFLCDIMIKTFFFFVHRHTYTHTNITHMYIDINYYITWIRFSLVCVFYHILLRIHDRLCGTFHLMHQQHYNLRHKENLLISKLILHYILNYRNDSFIIHKASSQQKTCLINLTNSRYLSVVYHVHCFFSCYLLIMPLFLFLTIYLTAM